MKEMNARVVLGDEFFEELRDFYRSIRKGNYQYKICLPRRCYVLGRIFMEIDGDSETTFDVNGCMTDSAVLSLCDEIADFFMENRKFPDILVCDDILIHGRAMNAFLVKFESRIIQCLRSRGCDLDDDKLLVELIASIDVRVYIKSSKSFLVLLRYLSKIKAERIAEPVVWRDLSNRISVLISESGVANANFVLSALVEEKTSIWRQAEYTEIETEYRKNKEIAYIKLLDFGTGVKAILTIRLNTTLKKNEKRIIPFVFLPHLNVNEKDIILQSIEKKLSDVAFSQIINNWRDNSNRLCSEFISLVLSQSLLCSFMQEYDIQEIKGEEKEIEIGKLAHNYGNSEAVYELIKSIKEKPLFSKEELIELIKQATAEARPMCKNADSHIFDKTTADKLMTIMEDIISEAGWQSEKEAYELWADGYIPTKLQYKETRISVLDFTAEVQKHADGNFSIYYAMAYMLQFMDAGLMVVSVYKSDEDEGGYAQYCKAGEQSITVQPKRNDKYIPLLVAINKRCSGAGLSVKKELENYIHRFSILEDDEAKLLDLLNKIKAAGQSIDDWDFIMQECINNEMETDDINERILKLIQRNYEIMDEQKKHIMQYSS